MGKDTYWKQYSPAHGTWKGSEIVICSNVYSHKEAYAILGKLRSYKGKGNVKFNKKTIVVNTAKHVPTQFPTKAPTPMAQLPGSRPSCASGVVMEIAGGARFQSATRLENTVSTDTNRAVNFMKKARKCMATTVGHKVKKCSMYAYTFTFLMAVPGQNMHNGNEVYDMIHYKNKKFIKNVNKCTGAGFYIPPKISLGNTFRPTKPSFETFNVSSIELTYVAPPLTPAPTPAATKKGNDCKVSKWSKHTQCSSSCGGGKQSAWRVIISPNAG